MCTQSKPNLDENRLIPIKDLMELTFVIPSYQRGYRWDEQQARDLLDDLYAFMTKPKNKEIYCLQPLVVSEVTNENGASVDDKEKSKWRVVDGQQRLTTIYLLLKYLEMSDEDKLFSIEYERDQETISRKDFLKNITEKGLDSAIKNVDFYHIYIVFNTIEKWFSEKAKENSSDKAFNDLKDLKKEYKDALLKDNILFLWDPIPPALETKTFTDLNSGRISLTNSELIKALFLNKNNFAEYPDDEQQSIQFKIAREWYEIENTLQNDEFWLFIHSRNYTKPTRIDFILQLMCKNDCFEILDDISKENLEALLRELVVDVLRVQAVAGALLGAVVRFLVADEHVERLLILRSGKDTALYLGDFCRVLLVLSSGDAVRVFKSGYVVHILQKAVEARAVAGGQELKGVRVLHIFDTETAQGTAPMRLGIGVILADDRLIHAECLVKFSLTAEVVAAVEPRRALVVRHLRQGHHRPAVFAGAKGLFFVDLDISAAHFAF